MDAFSILQKGIEIAATTTAVTFQIPFDSSGGKPKYIRVTATAPVYVKVGSDIISAVPGDVLVQPADSVHLKVGGCTLISVVSVSGSCKVNMMPTEGGSWNIQPPRIVSSDPSLALDFAQGSAFDPRITFTRASTATRTNSRGLIESVASGVPRVDYDPVTLACKGLLIEEQRTNLLTYSEQFDNAAWANQGGATITTNATTAPDGASTADTLIGTGGSYIDATISYTNGQIYCISFFVKYLSGGPVVSSIFYGSNFNSGGVNINPSFNLSTGLVNGTGNATNVQMVSVGNGWFRCSFCVTLTATAGSYTNQVIRTDSVASSIFIWGAQLEAGAFPTSYTPTVASQVTRAADVASMTGANFSSWYRSDEGTLTVDGILVGGVSGTFPYQVALVGANADTDSIGTYWQANAGTVRFGLRVSGSSQGEVSGAANKAANTPYKVAARYATNNMHAAFDGVLGTPDTTCTVPTVDALSIGGAVGYQNRSNVWLRSIGYYPKALTNVELQALSTQ